MRFLSNIPLLAFYSVFLVQVGAYAQADLSAQVLLSPADNESPQEAGLLSGRYQIRGPSAQAPINAEGPEAAVKVRLKRTVKTPATKLPAKKVQIKSLQDDNQMQTSVVVTPSKKPIPQKDSALAQSLFSATSTTRPSIIPTTTTLPTVETVVEKPVETNSSAVEVTPPSPLKVSEIENVSSAETTEPPVFDQPAVEAYKEQIHSDDIRLNQIEVTILPGVLNNDSKADYSFRDYSSFSPAVQFGAEFWFSPFLGAYGNYQTSLGADIVNNGIQNSRTPAKHERTEIGVDIRKFFGMSRRANSIEFGVNYSEYRFTVPGDELNRVKLKTAGFGFHFATRIPTAPSYAWIFGGTLAPRLSQSELGTGLNLQSGFTPETSRISFDVGGEFKMARQNQMIWKLGFGFEKTQYVGPANQVDPATGITPSGVSVRNKFTSFSLGYRWGQ